MMNRMLVIMKVMIRMKSMRILMIKGDDDATADEDDIIIERRPQRRR